jgi:hypothetical protein
MNCSTINGFSFAVFIFLKKIKHYLYIFNAIHFNLVTQITLKMSIQLQIIYTSSYLYQIYSICSNY